VEYALKALPVTEILEFVDNSGLMLVVEDQQAGVHL
jgi:hypothetical protein